MSAELLELAEDAPTRCEFFVAYRGSWEDPEGKGALAGPYPSLSYARDWVRILKIAREIMGPATEKQPLYIVRARARAARLNGGAA